jgi:hypothetical protein
MSSTASAAGPMRATMSRPAEVGPGPWLPRFRAGPGQLAPRIQRWRTLIGRIDHRPSNCTDANLNRDVNRRAAGLRRTRGALPERSPCRSPAAAARQREGPGAKPGSERHAHHICGEAQQPQSMSHRCRGGYERGPHPGRRVPIADSARSRWNSQERLSTTAILQ